MLRPVHPLAMLRIVLCALIALGLCLQPVLAAACDVEDAATMLEDGVYATSAHADGAGGSGDCCTNPACSDCCLHATASVPCSALSVTMPAPVHAATPLPDDMRPSDYPVDIRPPISS